MDVIKGFRIDSPNVVYERFENEVVIVHFESGNYYSLQKVGADIWNCVVEEYTMNEIIQEMTQRYEASQEEIESAVSQFLHELQQENLIVSTDRGGTSSVHDQKTRPVTDTTAERMLFETPILQRYTDMQDMLLLDPIHEIDEAGWPTAKPDLRDGNE